jgi:oligosaccharide repeat unit polymerase
MMDKTLLGASPQKTIRRFALAIARTPFRLLIAAWGAVLGLYFFGPLTFYNEPSQATWAFIALSTAAFGAGSVVPRFQPVKARQPLGPEPSPRQIELIARNMAWLGIFGFVCIAIDKLFLSGLDYSQGISALRVSQDNDVIMGRGVETSRTPLLYIGYLTFAFGIAAYLLYFLRAEWISRRTKLLCHVTIASPVGFALLYGGRSPIVLVITLAAGAAVVRGLAGRAHVLPQRRLGRLLVGVMLLAMLGYNSYIFAERRLYTGVQTFEQFLQRFEYIYQARPSPVALWLVDSAYAPPESVMTLLNTSFYLTHEFGALDQTLEYEGALGPYFGQYQFYLPAAMLERVVPSLSMVGLIREQGQHSGTYGWFSTAWGAMYLDFGWTGALCWSFLCGWMSAAIYKRALEEHSLAAELLMCYVVAGILISPNLSVFTVSISLPILAALSLAAFLVRAAPVALKSRPGMWPSWMPGTAR